MAQHYSPRLVTDNLVMCLDPSQNKSYPTTDLPVKGGLVMWMDAADDTTFSYSSGTAVSQWRDKSPSLFHMVPKSSGPTRSSSLNSRKVLTFTTTQTIGNNTINLSSSANTVFVVSRLTGTTNNRVLTCNLDASGNNWLLGHHGSTVNDYYSEGWIYDSATAADTTWRMFMGDWSGSSTDLANLYSNGTALVTNSTAASQGPKYLGVNYYSGETSTNEVAEIIVFNRVLTTIERKQIHTYLGQKWGILNTDRSVIDLSGFDDNGLLGNGTVANIPTYDYYNNSLRFDGSNDYIFLSNAQLNITSSITVEAWVKYNAQGGYNARSYSVITCKGYPWTWLLEDQSGQFNFRISTSITADSNVNSSYSHGLNTWNHVVGTYDGATQKIYVDGVLRSSTSLTGTINTSSNDALVGSYNYGDYCLTGNIGAVRVYSRALSATEISQNYEAQKSRFANTIVQQGLVLNLDAGNPYSYGGAGTTWYDVSGNNYNGTLTNGPVYDNVNSGRFLFDGTNDNVQLGTASTFLPTSAITINTWVKTNVVGVYKKIFVTVTSGTASVTGIYFSLGPSSDNVYLGIITNNGNQYATSSTTISTTSFVNLCGTYDGSNIRLYLNGTLIATQAQTGTITNSGIGRLSGYDSNTEIWDGYISAFSLYNRALSAAEVLQNYNALKGRFGL